MIFDTDLLIWCLRGNVTAGNLINQQSVRFLSAINYMEVVQGALNRRELLLIKSFLKANDFVVLPLSASIGASAIHLLELHGHAHGLRLADAMIAATALETGMQLCSANVKHFRMIRNLRLLPFSLGH